jgi:hypothetical protein
VFFEAWRHQFESQPVVALLQCIRTQISLSRKILNETGKIAEITAYTALAFLDKLIAGVPGDVAKTAREEGERWEADRLENALPSETFRSLFTEAIAQVTGKNGRMLVLIDDLDRCSEETTVRLLEAIKLHLSSPNCIFVIATDTRSVIRAVGRQFFKGDPDKDPSVRHQAEEYCGKLIQSAWELAVPEDLTPLMRLNLSQVEADLFVDLQNQHHFLPANPRKVKRFMSELAVRLDSFKRYYPGVSLDDKLAGLLAGVQSLQTFHPGVYRVLSAEPAFYIKLREFLERGPSIEDKDRPDCLKGLVVADRIL